MSPDSEESKIIELILRPWDFSNEQCSAVLVNSKSVLLSEDSVNAVQNSDVQMSKLSFHVLFRQVHVLFKYVIGFGVAL